MSLRMGESVLIPDFLFSQSGQQADANDVFDTTATLHRDHFALTILAVSYTKCLRYLRWGVAHCWIIDPVSRLAWQMDTSEIPREIQPADSLRAAGIEVKLADLFN